MYIRRKNRHSHNVFSIALIYLSLLMLAVGFGDKTADFGSK